MTRELGTNGGLLDPGTRDYIVVPGTSGVSLDPGTRDYIVLPSTWY